MGKVRQYCLKQYCKICAKRPISISKIPKRSGVMKDFLLLKIKREGENCAF
mgnify:CR=1 FL=1